MPDIILRLRNIGLCSFLTENSHLTMKIRSKDASVSNQRPRVHLTITYSSIIAGCINPILRLRIPPSLLDALNPLSSALRTTHFLLDVDILKCCLLTLVNIHITKIIPPVIVFGCITKQGFVGTV